ncbi:MAG: TetR-like C-terminal domain-containing protein, partial [Actinomycetota bacterium]
PADGLMAPISDELAGQIEAARNLSGLDLPDDQVLRGVTAWVLIYGLVNFELFGSFKNSFDDAGALFAHQIDLMAAYMGLAV